MFDNLVGDTLITLAVLIFVTVLMIIEGLYMLWRSYKGPEARKIEKRLQALSAGADHTAQARLVKTKIRLPAMHRQCTGNAARTGLIWRRCQIPVWTERMSISRAWPS